MSNHDNRPAPRVEPPTGGTILNDLFHFKIHRTLGRDFKDAYGFYLDEEKRARLARKHAAIRWLYVAGWFLKSIILKLTPARRLLILLALFLFAHNFSDLAFEDFVAFVVLFAVFTLEMKDKILARDELAIGRAMQRSLMPTRQPVLSGWDVWLFNRPANEVGGDLVDFISLGNDRLGIALGDVAGKGLGAALVMARLQATLRALAPESASLSDLGARMNGIFCRDGPANSFASLVYLELTADRDGVRFLNAGHMPPYHVPDGAPVEVPRGAPAIGLMPAALYQEQTLDVRPGESLVLYSDGVTECSNPQGELFGAERLLQTLPRTRGLSARDAGRLLVSTADQFAAGAKPSDDLSLIIIRRTGDSS